MYIGCRALYVDVINHSLPSWKTYGSAKPDAPGQSLQPIKRTKPGVSACLLSPAADTAGSLEQKPEQWQHCKTTNITNDAKLILWEDFKFRLRLSRTTKTVLNGIHKLYTIKILLFFKDLFDKSGLTLNQVSPLPHIRRKMDIAVGKTVGWDGFAVGKNIIRVLIHGFESYRHLWLFYHVSRWKTELKGQEKIFCKKVLAMKDPLQ